MLHVLDLKFQETPGLIAAFLVETKAGPVLIESGPASTLPNLEAALDEHGYAMADITDIFLTHIHLDHAGGAWHFAHNFNTRIHVHPRGAKHLTDPTRLLESAQRLYGERMLSLWGEVEPIPADNIVTHRHEEKTRIGRIWFKSFHTLGHANHHISWRAGTDMIAGDIAGMKLGDNLATVCTPPPDIEFDDWLRSIRLIKDVRPHRLFMTHFGEVEKQRDHLIEIEGRLRNFASFTENHLEIGTPPEEIVELFVEFYERQLRATDMSEEMVEQYMQLGAPRLSARGMLHYWKKQKAREEEFAY